VHTSTPMITCIAYNTSIIPCNRFITGTTWI
jgi:hypothetical protein